jgi:Wiskott-Aldrich syndrome protein
LHLLVRASNGLQRSVEGLSPLPTRRLGQHQAHPRSADRIPIPTPQLPPIPSHTREANRAAFSAPTPIRCPHPDSDAGVPTKAPTRETNRAPPHLRTYPTPYSPSTPVSTRFRRRAVATKAPTCENNRGLRPLPPPTFAPTAYYPTSYSLPTPAPASRTKPAHPDPLPIPIPEPQLPPNPPPAKTMAAFGRALISSAPTPLPTRRLGQHQAYPRSADRVPIPAPQLPPIPSNTREKLRPRPPHIRTYPTPYSPPTPAPQGRRPSPIRCPSRFRHRGCHQSPHPRKKSRGLGSAAPPPPHLPHFLLAA